MDFDEYRDAVETAEKLAASGRGKQAAEALARLAGAQGLPALDRAAAWVRAAEAHGSLGEPGRALECYDAAIALESRWSRLNASFKKAEYLLKLGRREESRALFASLLEREDATLAERRSIESRLKLLRRPAKS